MSKEKFADTVLSYNAIIKTQGIGENQSLKQEILNLQQDNGSWFESPYLTVLAIKALTCDSAIFEIKDASLKLFKVTDNSDEEEECYSYNSGENIKIKPECSSINDNFYIEYFIKDSDGKIINQIPEDQKDIWNTGNTEAGEYRAVVDVKDKISKAVLCEIEKTFVINEYFELDNIIIANDPKQVRVGTDKQINTQCILTTQSNIRIRY